MAFESLKRLEELKPKFPKWFSEVKPKDLMKGILTFMMLNYLMTKKLQFAEKFLEKLLQSKPENSVSQVELYITGIVFQLEAGDLREIDENIEFCNDKISSLKLPALEKRIFEATMSHLKLVKMKMTQDDEKD